MAAQSLWNRLRWYTKDKESKRAGEDDIVIRVFLCRVQQYLPEGQQRMLRVVTVEICPKEATDIYSVSLFLNRYWWEKVQPQSSSWQRGELEQYSLQQCLTILFRPCRQAVKVNILAQRESQRMNDPSLPRSR